MKDLYASIAKARIARKALKAKVKSLFNRKATGAIIWEGASPQDGQPIAAIVTGLNRPSANEKTGDMLQIWIIRTDIAPHEAVKSGADKSVCGNCTHRRGHGGLKDCYVIPHQAPNAVYKNYKAGKYPRLERRKDFNIFDNMLVRFGAYGDPAFIPLHIVRNIVKRAAGHTGYTHQGLNPRIENRTKYSAYFHASADSPKHAKLLQRDGWSTFETVYTTNKSLINGTLCAAESKGLSCELCQACNGQSKLNIFVHAHGSQSQKHIK